MTREEAIKWLIKPARTSTDIGEIKAKEIEAYNVAIEALRQPPNDDWERYADLLWKEAYERGKQDALKDRPKGEWEIDEYGIYHCPICHAINNTVYKSFCPNCGARMKGGGTE